MNQFKKSKSKAEVIKLGQIREQYYVPSKDHANDSETRIMKLDIE